VSLFIINKTRIAKRVIKQRKGANCLTMALSLSMLTTGCVVVGPDYKRPEIKVPEKFKAIEQQDTSEETLALKDEPWWSIYDDEILDALLQKIELKNYSVQAAFAQVQQSRSLTDIAKAGESPALVAGGVNDIGLLLSWEIDLWGPKHLPKQA